MSATQANEFSSHIPAQIKHGIKHVKWQLFCTL